MRYKLETLIECSHDEMVTFSKALSVMLPLMAPNVKIADTPSTTTPEQSK